MTKTQLKLLGLLVAVILVLIGLRVLDITFPWQKLTGQSDFISIEEATSQEVWGRTEGNEVYYWNSNCYKDSECNTWLVVKKVPGDLHNHPEVELTRGASCEELSEAVPVLADVVECVTTGIYMAEFGSRVFYALREDGSILKWESVFSFHLAIILQCALFIVLAITAIFLLIRKFKKKNL